MELVEISGNSWMNPHKYRQEVTNMQVQELVGIVPWNFIATICNLFIQVYLIKRFLFKPVNEMLEKRRAKADAEIQDAVKAKEEAEVMKAEYEKNMQEAKEKANDIVLTAQKTAAVQSFQSGNCHERKGRKRHCTGKT